MPMPMLPSLSITIESVYAEPPFIDRLKVIPAEPALFGDETSIVKPLASPL